MWWYSYLWLKWYYKLSSWLFIRLFGLKDLYRKFFKSFFIELEDVLLLVFVYFFCDYEWVWSFLL